MRVKAAWGGNAETECIECLVDECQALCYIKTLHKRMDSDPDSLGVNPDSVTL